MRWLVAESDFPPDPIHGMNIASSMRLAGARALRELVLILA
jgi:hypothetical protein